MLIDQGYNLVAVITKPDAAIGRHHQLTPPAVKILAEQHHIDVLQPTKLSGITEAIEALKPDAGVVVSYGKIIPQAIIDLFPLGLVNIHASLLPKYRGASPIEAAILAGDSETGVSLMRIEAGLDSGPVYAQSSLPISENSTKPELFETLSMLGTQLLSDILNKILIQELKPKIQDLKLVSHVGIIPKSAGILDWTKPAARLEREVRAYLSWPGSRTTVFGRDVIITASRVSPEQLKGTPGEPIINGQMLFMVTGDGILEIVRLKPAGRQDMPVAAFLAGIQANK